MGTPATWSSIKNTVETLYGGTCFVNGYWISISGTSIYSTTDFRGTWTTVARPSTKLSGTQSGGNAVIWDGTRYVHFWGSTGLMYATTPTGTWTDQTLTGVGAGNPMCCYYASNGTYVNAIGSTSDSTVKTYSATNPLGTWTLESSVAAPLSISGFIYENSYWYRVVQAGTAADIKVQKSSSLSGTWTDIQTFTSPANHFMADYTGDAGFRKHPNGYYTFVIKNAAPWSNARIYYSNNLDSWSTSDWKDINLLSWAGGANVVGPAWGGGYWVFAWGGSSANETRITYLQSATSPSGTWSTANDPWSGQAGMPMSLVYANNEFALQGNFTRYNLAGLSGSGVPESYQVDLTTSEQSLGTYTGYLVCELDLSSMTAGDIVELTAYSATFTGGTKRLLTRKTYVDAQSSSSTTQLVPVYAPYGVEFKIKKTNATGEVRVGYHIDTVGV